MRSLAAVVVISSWLGLAAGARAEPAPPPPGAPIGSGLVLEIGLGDALANVSGSSSSPVLLGLPVGRIFVGGKTGRAIAGLGLELTRLGFSSDGSGTSTSAAQTSLLLVAGVRYVIAQSNDERVELLGQLDFGVGHSFLSSSSGSASTPGNFRIVYEVGPGLRYWVHPQLALGGIAGLRGDYFSSDSTSGSSSSSASVTSIYTGVNLLGVF